MNRKGSWCPYSDKFCMETRCDNCAVFTTRKAKGTQLTQWLEELKTNPEEISIPKLVEEIEILYGK